MEINAESDSSPRPDDTSVSLRRGIVESSGARVRTETCRCLSAARAIRRPLEMSRLARAVITGSRASSKQLQRNTLYVHRDAFETSRDAFDLTPVYVFFFILLIRRSHRGHNRFSCAERVDRGTAQPPLEFFCK